MKSSAPEEAAQPTEPKHRLLQNPEPEQRVDDATDLTVLAPLIVVVTSAVIALSFVLTVLSVAGWADSLPAALRAAVVCLAALTLPGLPIAALLKLPSNGIFASVAIALSIAVNVLLAQTNFALSVHHPYLFQFLLLAVASTATALVGRHWQLHRAATSLRVPLAAIRTRLAPTGNRLPSVVLLLASLVLFGTAVARLQTGAAGRFGLLEALGVDYFIGLGLLCVVLTLEYRRSSIDRLMLALSNVALLIYITMPVAWSDRTAPFITAYVHRYITNWFLDLGSIAPAVDARMSWAGFFSAFAEMSTVGGLRDSGIFAMSASLVFCSLLIFPVYAIGLAISRDARTAWFGVTILALFNWYQQDYFAPQAMALQLYVTIVAVLLWQLRHSDVPTVTGSWIKRLSTSWTRIPGRVTGRDSRWTQSVELILVLVMAAMVVSHQLTPIVTIASLIVFSALGLTRYNLLWLGALLLFIAWFTYGAHAFWEGHLGEIITDIGGVDQNLTTSVAARIAGDPTYSRMQYLRIGASLLLLTCGFVGWLKRPKDLWWPLLGALAVVPFSLVLMQSYGGEVAIRSLLYASPVVAALAATVLLPLFTRTAKTSRFRLVPAISSAGLIFVVAVLIVTNRGLNTSFEHTTEEELAISTQLVDQAARGELSYWGQGGLYGIPVGNPGPRTPDSDPECAASASSLADCAADPQMKYFINSDQDENYLKYRFGLSDDTIKQAIGLLESEKGFVRVYEGDDIIVLKRSDAPSVSLGGQ